MKGTAARGLWFEQDLEQAKRLLLETTHPNSMVAEMSGFGSCSYFNQFFHERVGMTPRIFQGEADMFELVAATALGKETPETRDRDRTGKDVIVQLAQSREKK